MSGVNPERWISVDLILPEKDMVRVESAVTASGLRFVAFVRESVRRLAVKNGVELPEVPAAKTAYVSPTFPSRKRSEFPHSLARHPVTFPRSWHVGLNRTALALGLSKSAIVRVAVLARVNGVL